MNVIRYNPNRLFDFPLDRMFGDFWPRTASETDAPAAEAAMISPRVDIREEKDVVVLSAELPGVDPAGVKVELENGVLTISGEKNAETTENENGFYRSERVYGAFKRAFRVPETVDAEHIDAEYTHGVLKITLPKRPEAAPRAITIKEGKGDIKHIKS